MDRLIKTGKIKPKTSLEVKSSKIGIGFEKLDRDVFDPEKAYDKLGKLGVKWVRIQSGWQRTETEKGVYNFKWLDKVVDNLINLGLTPWICLCYGNALYGGMAKEIFGAVGCPPIFTDEQKQAWKNYVSAVVKHYEGRVSYFEIWNEPDGEWCWKHGVSGTELGVFTRETAKTIKSANPNAKTIGGALCLRPITFINDAFATGMGEYLDFISFHEYTADETLVFERVKALKALAQSYNPNIDIIQGESGSQSRGGGHGALWRGCWTPEKQAKQLARHTIADLITNVHFTSYFSCMDMIEALGGKVGDVNSYLDYGYFGVLGAEFDENGRSIGEYSPKKSYYTLQNIASVFADDYELCDIPAMFVPQKSERIFKYDIERNKCVTGGFKKNGGKAFVYWYPSDIMTTSFESTVSMEIYSEYDDIYVIDVMDGSVYKIPDEILKRDKNGMYTLTNMPVKDTPLIIAFGKFADWEEEK